jgi:hypothetical protein
MASRVTISFSRRTLLYGVIVCLNVSPFYHTFLKYFRTLLILEFLFRLVPSRKNKLFVSQCAKYVSVFSLSA